MTQKPFIPSEQKPLEKRLREQFGLLSIKLDSRSESFFANFLRTKSSVIRVSSFLCRTSSGASDLTRAARLRSRSLQIPGTRTVRAEKSDRRMEGLPPFVPQKIYFADDDFSHVTAKVVDYDGVGPHNVPYFEGEIPMKSVSCVGP
jgi:hypothetical protein